MGRTSFPQEVMGVGSTAGDWSPVRSRRSESPWWGAALILGYALAALSGLIVAAALFPGTGNAFSYELGRSFALTAVAIVALQFALSARLHLAERPFGFDMVIRYHKAMGVLVLCLLASHPVLLALGGAGSRLLTRLDVPWNIWFGRAALLLLLVQVLSSAFRRPLRLGFEHWRLLHNQAALIIGLAAVHARVTGGDFGFRPLQVFWIALVAIAFAAYLYHKAIRPSTLSRRPYRVVDVKPQAHRVWTISFGPPAGRQRFGFRPGQFHFVHLRRGRGLPSEEHHFTISSSPTDSVLSSTIKESGDFTSTIGETKPGDLAAVDGPYGRFSYTYRSAESDLVFIAGGIGITPIMSMLRHMRDTGADKDALLVYVNRAERDIVFREELDAIAGGERPRLRVVHVLTRPEGNWNGETGHLDRDRLARLIGSEYRQKMCYVCGPSPMMAKVVRALQELGVPASRIEYERFSL